MPPIGHEAAIHTSRQLFRPSSKRRHSKTQIPASRAAAPESTPVPRPCPCEVDDIAIQVTKADTPHHEGKNQIRRSDIHAGPRAMHTPSW
jgi:hypothetical protein